MVFCVWGCFYGFVVVGYFLWFCFVDGRSLVISFFGGKGMLDVKYFDIMGGWNLWIENYYWVVYWVVEWGEGWKW